MEGEQQLHKRHMPKKLKHAVQQRKKKQQRKEGSSATSAAPHNPKAFTFSGGVVSVQRRVQRSLDKLSLKAKEEKIDKTPDIPPPYIVVVHGPPNVGKTTLIRSLVRHYTRHALQVVRGPITVVASQQRRLTFVECSGTDVQQMLDAAKIADLVLLLIDASFGFEMETFEFINILQTHGFPRIIGVLTRLDRVGARRAQRPSLPRPPRSSSSSNSPSGDAMDKKKIDASSSTGVSPPQSSSNSSRREESSTSSNSGSTGKKGGDREDEERAAESRAAATQQVRRRKKELKKRFWAEIYDGAKLFYLTGLQYEGKYYKKREVLNLSRYIAVQRFATLSWRSAHPYLLALRCEPLAPLLLPGTPHAGAESSSSRILKDRGHTAAPRSNRSDSGAKGNAAGDAEEEKGRSAWSLLRRDDTHSFSSTAAAAASEEAAAAAAGHAACAFYGYVRGAVLRLGQWIHIPGAGDFQIKSLSCCEDPCPPPALAKMRDDVTAAAAAAAGGQGEGEGTATAAAARRNRRMRSLKDRQRAIYAPAADVGNVHVDTDAMYIHLPDSAVSFTRPELLIREGEEKKKLQQVAELQKEETASSSSGKKKSSSGSSKDTSGSTCSSSSNESHTSGEETEESSEDDEEDAGGIASLGAGSRAAVGREGAPKAAEVGDAVKMVRELQEAQQVLHVLQQKQQLRLLPTSACALDAPAAASSGVRQLSAVCEAEEEEWENMAHEEVDEEEDEAEEDEEEAAERRCRRAAPPAAAAEAATDSDVASSDATATCEATTEEEDEGEAAEDEEDEEMAIEAVHAAARRRFQRAPCLQEVLYSSGAAWQVRQQQQDRGRREGKSGGRAAAGQEPQGSSRLHGSVAALLGTRTLPLFEEEEEEDEPSTTAERSEGTSAAAQGSSSSSRRQQLPRLLYGSLPAVRLSLLPRDDRGGVSHSSSSSPTDMRKGHVPQQEEGEAASAAAAAAGREGRAPAAFCVVEEEEDEAADSATVNDDALYAAAGVGPTEQQKRSYWTSATIERLKACYFITGGWSSAEESDKEKSNSSSKAARGDAGTASGVLQQQPEAEDALHRQQQQQQAAETKRLMLEARELQQQEQQLQGGGEGDAAARGYGSGSSSHLQQSSACACIGTFVRVCVEQLPVRWLQRLSADRPVLLGGLSAGERGHSYLKMRAKKHRWYPRVLKSDDVLLFSAGWRRFQSLPLFAMEDRSSARLRYLKYTPAHLHCMCCTWGPVLPAATPFLALRFTHATPHFRICLTGLLLETTASLVLKKKLKLLGEPQKIYKNTAFVAQMFNSDVEVNMCLGAKIQTVSGIRGQIKQPHGSNGVFRATFEDKILLSDLVLCKTWLSLQPRQFYNAVLDMPGWRRLRTQVEIRHALQLPTPGSHLTQAATAAGPASSSAAGKEEEDGSGKWEGNTGGVGALQNERRATVFAPIKIPKQLMLKLPFHARTKLQLRTSRLKKLKGREKEEEEEMRKPLVSAYDRHVAALLQRLQTIRNVRLEKKKEKQRQKLDKKAAAAAKEAAAKSKKQLEIRRKRYIKQGKVETVMRKKMRFASSN